MGNCPLDSFLFRPLPVTLRILFQVFWFTCGRGRQHWNSVDQTGLELRNLSASASRVLGLQACATTTQHSNSYKDNI